MKTRPHEAPTLFDQPAARSIPVGAVSQPAWEPGIDDEPEGDRESANRDDARRDRRAGFDDEPARDDRFARGDEPVADEGDAGVTTTKRPSAAASTKEAPPAATRATARAPHAAAAPPAKAAARAPKRKSGQRGATAETMAAQQRDISVSEFFAKNRHLLGFDNKRKALLTTVKEAVDNSLDACEEAGILPEIWIAIDQLAEERFRVAVRDNGPGIVKSQIANIFGKLLYGSKFHRLKMSRGQQGIGISAAGMYGLLTTGRSVLITSRTGPDRPAHHMQIQMDTAKNRADVIVDEEVERPWERGTEVEIELVASYAKGRQSVDEYVEQTAIANPHALIHYASPVPEQRDFPRGTEELPAETRAIQPHPHGIELGVLMKMLKDAGLKRRDDGNGDTSRTLAGFLQNSFCRVSERVAREICETADLNPRSRPLEIGTHDVEQLYTAMQSVKIMAPPTDCLAPIGVRNLLAGLLKEVKAEFFTATTRDPAVYRGNPFQIEIALAYGGSLAGDETARIIRFANRVPLLYQQSACAAFKSVLDVDWRNYGLSQPGGTLPVGPLVVMIHMASVWVPFTSESKEAIADYDEIRKEMRLALQECGRKLAAYVRRRRRQRLEAQRRDIFSRYIPDVAEALANLTGEAEDRLRSALEEIARKRTADADVELDEDGRVVAKEAAEAAEAGESGAAADEPTLVDDGTTIIVPENEARDTAGDLFDDDDDTNGANGAARRPRGKRRRKG